MAEATTIERENATLRKDVAERDASITALRDVITSLEEKQAALESALINYANEIELLKRRLFGPRSERTGTSELQIPLLDVLAADVPLQKQLDELKEPQVGVGEAPASSESEPPSAAAYASDSSDDPKRERAKPKGRRDLSVSTLPKSVTAARTRRVRPARPARSRRHGETSQLG
jgi:hypothetical protein